jgi:hypothetical protein
MIAVRLALAALILWIGATCAGCVTQFKLGADPISVGFEAKCETPDGCVVGVEAGGWRVGAAVFPDIGPVNDADPSVE